jgi:hypothetical protein
MEVPCLDWPRIDRRDAVHTEDERSSGSRSLDSGTSGSSGGVHGGGGDELGPGEWTSSSDLAESPPLLGAGNQRCV